MNVDISNWNKRNVDVLPSGELCVRQSFKRLSSTFLSLIMVRAWTVKCQTTDVIWHYIMTNDATNGVRIFILDENEQQIQIYSYNTFVTPRDVTLSVIEDQLIICSPDLPAVWGIVGSGLVLATSVDSVNTMTTALENIPQGIAVAWAGRNVIATRETLYFSDALYPRTYTGQNAVDPPGGSIYGLHVSAGGALIVCTTNGVYALPEDAAASGQIVIGIFSKLTDYECINYKTTTVCKGRVYGLTQRGYRLIDEKDGHEVYLDERTGSVPALSIETNGRIHFNDYREGAIYAGQDTLYVHMGERFVHYTNLSFGLRSWWTSTSSGFFQYFGGVGFDNDGSEILFLKGLYFRNGNNGTEGNPQAVISGRLELPPDLSPVIRQITFASDSYNDFEFGVLNAVKTATPKRYSPIIGTDTWSGGSKYIEPRVQSRDTNWAVRGDDIYIALGIREHPAKIPSSIDIVFKGPGKKRPTN